MSKLKIKIDLLRREMAYPALGAPVASEIVHIWIDGYPDREADAKRLAEQLEHKLARALPHWPMVLYVDYGALGLGGQPALAVREMVDRGEMPGRHLVFVSGAAELGLFEKASTVVFDHLLDGLTADELEELRAQLAEQMAAQS